TPDNLNHMEYSEKYINEFVRDLDPYCIFVIAGRRLYKVRTPFKVRVLIDVAGLKVGDEKWVEKVMVTRDLQMVYLIGGSGYHYFLFQILLY
ncbi:MAG: hypothetical protein WAL94_03400, partial [Bacteroidales bacterium]